METTQFEPESNAALPSLSITKRRTKKTTESSYLEGTNLKSFDLQEIIRQRVNKEAEVLYEKLRN